MGTMNMPGFTADASLYRTKVHYQTGRRAFNSAERARVYPSEVIVIEGEAPMELPWGWGPEGWEEQTTGAGMGVEFGGGGGGGGRGGGRGRGRGGGRRTPPRKEPKVSHGCTMKQIQSKTAAPCLDQQIEDVLNDVENVHYVKCTATDMFCCQDIDGGGRNCEAVEPS